MAIASPAPIADDLVTIDEAVAFLSQSGHRVSETTLRNWIARYGIKRIKVRRAHYMSMSDLLRAQRDELDRLGE